MGWRGEEGLAGRVRAGQWALTESTWWAGERAGGGAARPPPGARRSRGGGRPSTGSG